MTLLAVVTAVQFVILLGLAVVVLSLARQVGILHERLTPAGMIRSQQEVKPGERVPEVELPLLSGGSVALGEPNGNGAALTALLFISADCPICKSVLPAYQAQLDQAANGCRGFWVADGTPGADGAVPDYAAYVDRYAIEPDRFAISPELARVLGVRQIPALALLDEDARLLTLETVTGPRQLGRLFAVRPAGTSSENGL
jgi:methylamine dehydrogenase accessory protein MauD